MALGFTHRSGHGSALAVGSTASCLSCLSSFGGIDRLGRCFLGIVEAKQLVLKSTSSHRACARKEAMFHMQQGQLHQELPLRHST